MLPPTLRQYASVRLPVCVPFPSSTLQNEKRRFPCLFGTCACDWSLSHFLSRFFVLTQVLSSRTRLHRDAHKHLAQLRTHPFVCVCVCACIYLPTHTPTHPPLFRSCSPSPAFFRSSLPLVYPIMSDSPQHPHSQQKLQITRGPARVSFASSMSNTVPARRQSRVPMRRHLPRIVAVPPVLTPNWSGDVASPHSIFAPPLPQMTAELGVGNDNLSVGGATLGSPGDNNDISFPFRASLGGIAVPLQRMCLTPEGGEPTVGSARLDKEDADEQARFLEEYRTRFARRRRQARGNSINASTDGISSVGERDACSHDAACSVKSTAVGELAMFQAMTSTACSARSLVGCASLPESLGVGVAAGHRRSTHDEENEEDAQNVTMCSATPQPLRASKKSIDSGSDVESSGASLALAVTHGRAAAQSGPLTHVTRFSAAGGARTRKVDALEVVQVRLSAQRQRQERSRPVPPEPQTPRASYSRTQRDVGLSNSYTFGVDEHTSGCSW